MIVTTGTIVGDREYELVQDALSKLSDPIHHSDYKAMFEEKFAEYVGKKYAMNTNQGTTALKLAFAAIGLTKGDEVIVPDLCYFSPIDVIVEMGAKPVFVDVDSSWCISLDRIEPAITKKTKAIMPVYMYGQLPRSKDILDIARRHGLYVIDDACPAVGSLYDGKHAGYYSDIACFSFQAAKIITTGLGGMLVTDNKQLWERAKFLNYQGESYNKKFFQTEHGYNFEMTNLESALGIAQLERIESFVKIKRQIYEWYREFLGIKGFMKEPTMNKLTIDDDKTPIRPNLWLTSIIVYKNRNTVIKELKQKGIDTRPFFYPASSFPMYDEADTPNSHYFASQGINLPSKVTLKKEDIKKVCQELKKYL